VRGQTGFSLSDWRETAEESPRTDKGQEQRLRRGGRLPRARVCTYTRIRARARSSRPTVSLRRGMELLPLSHLTFSHAVSIAQRASGFSLLPSPFSSGDRRPCASPPPRASIRRRHHTLAHTLGREKEGNDDEGRS
jgi:hypothetical protein